MVSALLNAPPVAGLRGPARQPSGFNRILGGAVATVASVKRVVGAVSPGGRAVALAAAIALVAPLAGCGGVNVVKKQKLELKPIQTPLRAFSFPSGLRVIVERDTRTSLAGVFVVVGSGSSSDPAGKEGLAHYVEHLAFQSRPFGAESFSDLLDKSGAVERNAFTDFDSTTYYEIGPAAALPQLLRTEAVRMVVPVSDVPEAARAIELDVVRNELRERNETGFIGDVHSRLLAALFSAGHPYARSIGGSHQSLGTLGKADVDAFAKAHYRPDNMTLLVVGNVDLDRAEDLLADSLPGQLVAAPAPVTLRERLPAAPPAVPAPPPAPGAPPRFEAAISAPELWVGWTFPRGFDRDGYVLSFLASAARGHFARLGSDDRDIVRIDVFPSPGKEASMLLCRVVLRRAADPEKTLKVVLSEAPKIVNQFMIDPNDENISRMVGSQFTFAEMAYSRARRVVLVEEMLGLQDLVGRGVRRATVTHFSQDPALMSHAMRDLAELKPERFQAFGRPYLTSERARAVLFVPTGGTAGRSAPDEAAALPAPDRKTARVAPPAKEWLSALAASGTRLATRRLENGLTVVLAPRPGLPLVTAALSISVPQAAAQDAGSAAFVRAMGWPASRFNDPSEYGGAVHVSSAADHLSASVEGSSGNAEAILATLAERVRSMHVESVDSVGFKAYVLPNHELAEKEPHTLAGRQYFAKLLPGNPYVRVAPFDEVAAAGPAAARQWIERTYRPENATLVVAGEFEPTEVQRWIDDSFGGWRATAEPALAGPQPAAAGPRSELVTFATPRPGGTQGEVRFGCRLPDVTSGAMAARHGLAAAVARTRLWDLLRDKLGATYGVRVHSTTLPGGTSWLEVGANVENAKLAAVLGELRKVLQDLSTTPVSADALGWARYERAAGVAKSQLSNGAFAGAVLARARLGLSPDLAEVRGELESVTAQDLVADFKSCLATQPTLSIVGEEAVARAALDAHGKAAARP